MEIQALLIVGKYFFIGLLVIFLFGQFISWITKYDTDNTNEPEWKNESDDLQGAIVSYVNNHTIIVTHGKRRFLVSKEQDGTPYTQEVNIKNNTLGKKVYGMNRQEINESKNVADYIKRKINSGR